MANPVTDPFGGQDPWSYDFWLSHKAPGAANSTAAQVVGGPPAPSAPKPPPGPGTGVPTKPGMGATATPSFPGMPTFAPGGRGGMFKAAPAGGRGAGLGGILDLLAQRQANQAPALGTYWTSGPGAAPSAGGVSAPGTFAYGTAAGSATMPGAPAGAKPMAAEWGYMDGPAMGAAPGAMPWMTSPQGWGTAFPSGLPYGNPGASPGSGMPPPSVGAWAPPSPWSSGPAGNENRSISMQGLDPRLDALFGYGLNEAMRNYMNPEGMSFYGGPTVAGLTPEEIAAQRYTMGVAGSMGGTAAGGLNFLDQLLANGANPGANPQVDAAIRATLDDVTQQFTDPGGAFSAIRNSALGNGAYGGTRQGVMEALAAERLADSLGGTSARMRLDARGQDINAGLGAVGNQGNFGSLAMLPASMMGGVGAQNRNMDQAFMNDALTRWLYNTNQPNVRLQNLYNFMGASPLGGWGSSSNWLSDAALNQGGGNSTAQNIVGGVSGVAGTLSVLRELGLI